MLSSDVRSSENLMRCSFLSRYLFWSGLFQNLDSGSQNSAWQLWLTTVFGQAARQPTQRRHWKAPILRASEEGAGGGTVVWSTTNTFCGCEHQPSPVCVHTAVSWRPGRPSPLSLTPATSLLPVALASHLNKPFSSHVYQTQSQRDYLINCRCGEDVQKLKAI